MTLSAGTRLGPYEIAAQIGVGGMGEVYRATDTNLKRAVAIKVLPASVAADAERLARFQREAEVLASLNHPNIAQIHGLEKSDGITALVMELVEGPTLADRITQGAIPLDEALPIAKQIAEALEAAHEQGIIHRDLKPANIKVRPDGTVKVLDFGLAKALGPAEAGHYVGDRGVRLQPDLSQSPTITTPAMTQAGMILGTAAYMSPEQARGKVVDKRADIWAFGCVLFEMLTGTRAFDGGDVQDTFVAIMRDEPDWARLPATLPLALGTYIRRCLHKDPRQRIHDIADVRLALEGAFETAVPLKAVQVVLAQPVGWRRVRIPAVTAVVIAVVAACVAVAATWVTTRPADLEPPRVSRLPLAFSPATTLTMNGNDRDLAITPDGSRLVYVGNHGTQLFVRAFDTLEPVAVFAGAPRGPFVSPDGQWIAFVDGNNLLKRVAVTGGPAVTLATLDQSGPRGATWGPEDTVIVATASVATGLRKVAAAGGPITVLTRPDRARGEAGHFWPEFLPGGRAVLFTIMPVTGGLDAAQVAVLDLETGAYRVLFAGGSHAIYLSSGHLVYTEAGTLRAVLFDLARLETRGTSAPVVPGVATTSSGAADAVVAGDGTLVYVSGGVGAGAARTLVWVDRQGRETPIPAPPREYSDPRLSPDGTRIAFRTNEQERDVWVWDLGRTTLSRFTFDPAYDGYPVWTPDGRRLLFSSERTGTRNLFWQAADGTGAVERLMESATPQNPVALSPDGRQLIFTETAPKTGEDVMQMALDGTRRVTPLVQSPFAERNGTISPDGRWLAYEANDSGRFEISVRPFPEVNRGRWQVSSGGGTRPLWARTGQELFYVSQTGAIMRVGVERGLSWAATPPTLLVKDNYYTNPSGNSGRSYDIVPDGQRFLMVRNSGVDPTAILVQHWVEELKRLVPTK